jgi:hypothetical protein
MASSRLFDYEKAVLRRLLVVAVLMLLPRAALAQVHWDAAAEVGVMKRFLAERPQGGDDAGFGPIGQVNAHVALLPLVRVGGYFGYELSPFAGDASTRSLFGGGLRAKVMSPWPRGNVRGWLFAGFGYMAAYAPSYDTPVTVPSGISGQTTAAQGHVAGAGGGFFEIPLGIGASYKLYGAWSLVGELGVRIGLGHTGSAYEDPGPTLKIDGQPDNNVLPAGRDRYGTSLAVGIQLDL